MFCPKCGKEIQEDVQFCPSCGAELKTPETPSDFYNPDKTALFDEKDIVRTKYLAALCYLGISFIIIALLIEPDSKFLRYHINQSIMLYIMGIVSILVAIVPILGWIAAVIISIASLVFLIMGACRALGGRAEDLPIIGKYTVVHSYD